jgi:hypothetical protein
LTAEHEPPDTAGRPWDPGVLLGVAVLGGPLAGGVLFGWNEQHLGRPAAMPRLVRDFAVLQIALSLAAYWLTPLVSPGLGTGLTLEALAVVAAIPFAARVARAQSREMKERRLVGGAPELVPAIVAVTAGWTFSAMAYALVGGLAAR